MKAIILAAGSSTRMHPLAQGEPKCLLALTEKENILDRQLRILNNCEVKEIVVVVGFKKEKIIKNYKDKVSIFSVEYYDVGSAHSLWSARAVLDGSCLILNSDVIFTDKIIKNLLKNQNTYCLAVEKKHCNSEAQRVKTRAKKVIEIGKYLGADEAYGEFLGIAKIKKEGIEGFKKQLGQTIRDNPPVFFVEVFNYLIKQGKKVNFIKITSSWMEIDTPEDYQNAKQMLSYLD